MKLTKKHNAIPALFCILFINSVCAKVAEYIEDAYAKQAPKKIVTIAKKTALLMDFEDTHEVAVPKKAGIQVNPAYKFIAYGRNPQTKNPFIIVNPQWFSSIPQGQQTFLLGRCFIALKRRVPLSIKIIPYLFSLFSILFICLLVWGLGKTRLAHHKMWVKILIALGVSAICNLTVMFRLQTSLIQHLNYRYDIKTNKMVVQKTLDNDSAIKALEFFDSSIKNELKKGETFWTPYKSLFKNYADKLRK